MNEGIKRKNDEVDVERINELGYDFLPLSFEATGGFDVRTEKACLYFLSEKAKIQNRELTEVTAEFWQTLSIIMQRWSAHMIRSRMAEQGHL